jgi:hypothetical protein
LPLLGLLLFLLLLLALERLELVVVPEVLVAQPVDWRTKTT